MPDTSILSVIVSLFLGGTSVYFLIINITMVALLFLMILILYELIQSQKNELHI